MGYKNNDPCLKKAYEDEGLFILMTRDSTSPQVVVEWIKLNILTQPPEKLHEALDCAVEMAKNQKYFHDKKVREELDAKMSKKQKQ
jgi:hypothetical protein